MWLSVYFPALLIPKNSPEQGATNAGKPVVVYDANTNQVVQCNQPALAVGIELGMGLGSVSALSAELEIIPYSAEEERLLLTEIMYKLYQLNSDICLEHSNELLIRCDRHDYYYGSRDVHLRVLLRQLASYQQPFHFATANTPEQASVLARARIDTLLDEDQVLPKLQQLGITQLRFDTKTIQQLQRVGVRSVKALFALPMEELAGRFSQSVIKMIYALKGLHKFGRVFYQPTETFCESLELPFDMEAHEHLFRWASSLLTLLQSYLRSRNQTTQQLNLLLTDSEKCVHSLVLRSGAAKYRVEDWQPVLTLTLEKTTLTHPIRRMELRCDTVMQASPDATDLFLGKRGNTVEAHKLFDVLQTRLGDGAFHPPHSEAYRFAREWPTAAATPAFMLNHAHVLTLPSHVVAGPQRIQTGWWHTPLKRDYFLVETQDAERLWAFRNEHQQWFFQGWFS